MLLHWVSFFKWIGSLVLQKWLGKEVMHEIKWRGACKFGELFMKMGWWGMWSSLFNLNCFRKKNWQEAGLFILIYPWTLLWYAFYYTRILCSCQQCRISHTGSWGSDIGGSVHMELIIGSHTLAVKSHEDFKDWLWVWSRGSYRDSHILITSGRFTEMLKELLICLNRKGVLPSKPLGAQEVNTRELRSNRYPEVCWGPCYK